MKKSRQIYDFNGGWTAGQACRQIGIKNTEKTHRSKKQYNRRNKHKFSYEEE